MKILKNGGGGGNEIHAPCACELNRWAQHSHQTWNRTELDSFSFSREDTALSPPFPYKCMSFVYFEKEKQTPQLGQNKFRHPCQIWKYLVSITIMDYR
jgi:hypothetical protein